jgi:cytochrome b561
LQSSALVSFSFPQRILHWLTAALVFFNLLLPDGMNEWHRSMRRNGSATADQIASANVHAYVGIGILLLVFLRLVLRLYQGAPPSPSREPAIFRLAAKVAQVVLYVLLLAMPVTGMASYYLGYDSVGGVHADILKVVVWAVLGAHVLGVLIHQFYWKTDVLRRMTVG